MMEPKRDIASAERDESASESGEVDLDQIVERLEWSPAERLRYLLDMLRFEEKAHRAKPADR